MKSEVERVVFIENLRDFLGVKEEEIEINGWSLIPGLGNEEGDTKGRSQFLRV